MMLSRYFSALSRASFFSAVLFLLFEVVIYLVDSYRLAVKEAADKVAPVFLCVTLVCFAVAFSDAFIRACVKVAAAKTDRTLVIVRAVHDVALYV